MIAKENSSHLSQQMIEAMLMPRLHWSKWLGITSGLVCVFFAIRNKVFQNRAGIKNVG